jgi:hypothetical protein
MPLARPVQLERRDAGTRIWPESDVAATGIRSQPGVMPGPSPGPGPILTVTVTVPLAA